MGKQLAMGRARVISIFAVLMTFRLASADLVVKDSTLAPSLFHSTGAGPAGAVLVDTGLAAAVASANDRSTLNELCPDAGDWRIHLDAIQRTSIADLVTLPPAGSVHASSLGGTGASRAAHENVIELPPPPDGGTLTLSGLLTLGGLQLARSARQIRIGSLPEWYAATCPDQIGHVVAVNLDLTDMPVCRFTEPADPQSVIHRGPRDTFVLQLLPQCTLSPSAPRGPPCCA
jgi:hypothetical protein